MAVVTPSSRRLRAAKFWQSLRKGARLSFSWQECSRRWAGAPRTHSTPEISQGPKFRKKQARRRQGGKDQDTDTRAHTPTHTLTCTNSRGIAAGGLADFATEISLRRAFYRFSSRGLPSSLPPPPPPPPPPVRPQFRTSRHTLFRISGPSPEFPPPGLEPGSLG